MGTRLGIGSAGSLLMSSGSVPDWANLATAQDNTNFTFTNASYLALDSVTGGTPGNAVEVDLTLVSSRIWCFWRCNMTNSGTNANFLTIGVTGDLTKGSSDSEALRYTPGSAGREFQASQSTLITTASAGDSVTVKLRARTAGGTCTMKNVELMVLG